MVFNYCRLIRDKKEKIRSLIRDIHLDFIAIQETSGRLSMIVCVVLFGEKTIYVVFLPFGWE